MPPGHHPPPKSKGPLFAALAGVVLLVTVAVVSVVTLADEREPVAQSAPSAPPARPTAPVAPPPEPAVPSFPAAPPAPANPGGVDLAVGECADFVVASEVNAELVPADCADPAASHVVAAQVAERADCPSDVDVTYYETNFEVETLALCLDVNWRVGVCYDITDGPGATEQVDCVRVPGRSVEQVESVLMDVATVDDCSQGGFAYDERRKVVCTVTVE